MIKLKDILKEIGEGTSKPYKYEYSYGDDDSISYTFRTDSSVDMQTGKTTRGTDYEVDLLFIDSETMERTPNTMDVSFRPTGGEYEEETNQNVQYRIMATVVAIMKEVLPKHPEVTHLIYTPTKSDSNDSRRANLYKAYIQKQLPGSRVKEFSGGKYKIELPNK